MKSRAKQILKEHGQDIKTSEATFIELMLLAKRYDLDVSRLFTDVMAICHESNPLYLNAASYFEEGLNVFDSFHAAHAEGLIISSDTHYEKVGLKRIQIEEE